VGSVGSVGSFSHYLVYLETIIFFFYTELKCLLAPLLKTYPCEPLLPPLPLLFTSYFLFLISYFLFPTTHYPICS
jgi:hypothetical protein